MEKKHVWTHLRPENWTRSTFYMSEKEFLANSPSRQLGMTVSQEMILRTLANAFIHDLGTKLSLPSIVINHGATTMHRYFCLKGFVQFKEKLHCPCNKRSEYYPLLFFDAAVAGAILFISTKFEEKVRKSDHLRRCLSIYFSSKEKPGSCKDCQCGYHQNPTEFLDKLTDDIHDMEQEVLRVLGFQLEVAHPHVEMMQLLRLTGTRHELGQTAYFLTSTCNQITPFCLYHTPEEIAAICLYTTLKWSGFEIPKSAEGKHWTEYLKTPMSLETLAAKSGELVNYANNMPQNCKAKLCRWRGGSTGTRDISRSIQMNPEVNGGQSSQGGSANSAPGSSDRTPKKISMMDYIQNRNQGTSHGSMGSQNASSDSALTPVDRQGLRDKDRHAQGPPQGFHRSGGSSRSGSQGQSSKDNGRANNAHGIPHHTQHRSSGSNGQKRPREDDDSSSSRSGSHSHGSGTMHLDPASKKVRTEGMGSSIESSAGAPHSGYRSSSQHSGRHTSHMGSSMGHSSNVPAGYSMGLTNASKAPQGYHGSRNSKPGLPQGPERSHDAAHLRDAVSRSHHTSSSHRPPAQLGHAPSSMRSKLSSRSHLYGSSGRHETQSQRQSSVWPSGDSHMTEGGSPMDVTNTSPRDIELGSIPSNSYHSSPNIPPGLPPKSSQSGRR